MRKLIALALVCLSVAACTRAKPEAKKTNYQPSDVVANEFVFSGDPAVVGSYLKAQGVEAQFIELSPEDKWYQVKFKGELEINQLIADLKDKTTHVEPNFRIDVDSSMHKADWPSAKYFFKQWALNNIGQSAPFGLPGVRGADMDILKVWDKVTKGSDKIIVALVDTGCDYTHPNLQPNIWVNEKESPANGGIAGKDDDGNGYIDDIYGYNFVSSGTTSMKGMPGSPDPMDTGGHGTHCAGSIGAVPNNGNGVAGLNQKIKIMCVRFLGEGGGSSVDGYRAIRYARENHANIMSNSWGGKADESELFKSEMIKIQEAGILFVAAAGNDGENNDVTSHFPTNLKNTTYNGVKIENVLSVAASDNADNPASFSNYGHEKVDVFAPGVAILSTYPTGMTVKGRFPYATMSGTSMATPYVAAVAALMMAANPSLIGKPREIIRIINNTADIKEAMIGKVISNGRINAYRAVTADLSSPQVSPVWQTKAHVIDQRSFNQEQVDIRQEIKIEGAKQIKVHFDFMQIEEPYDSVYLYDKDYRLISQVQKTDTGDFWSPAIPGDTVYVRFVNSLVQQVTMSPLKGSSEADCVTRGATSVEMTGDGKFQCMVDSEDSSPSGSGSKKFNTFNSEGYRIDQVSYVMAGGKEQPAAPGKDN